MKQKNQATTKREPISRKLRFDVFNRDNFTCTYCGQKSPAVVLHVDHIKPVAKGGSNDMANLTTACSACNSGKSATEIISAIEKPIPSLAIQVESYEWKIKRHEIIERDDCKCARCGSEDDLYTKLIDYRDGIYIVDINNSEFITMCHNCGDKVEKMRRSIHSFVDNAITGYRFHDIDSLSYIEKFTGAIEVGDPEHPLVQNIFNAVDLYFKHEELISKEREEYEEHE